MKYRVAVSICDKPFFNGHCSGNENLLTYKVFGYDNIEKIKTEVINYIPLLCRKYKMAPGAIYVSYVADGKNYFDACDYIMRWDGEKINEGVNENV